ncbi:protein of unknown function [Paraburkholderia dioscoreae]|uniref:Uncharacterized protein n=1 Tax=Paraburkholderia dioscoreae TaxID=2604047 RepID=A0A5Q4ZH96_9BURK|nr:protein of unknown function [Paraburkholderia dioscoreae]
MADVTDLSAYREERAKQTVSSVRPPRGRAASQSPPPLEAVRPPPTSPSEKNISGSLTVEIDDEGGLHFKRTGICTACDAVTRYALAQMLSHFCDRDPSLPW